MLFLVPYMLIPITAQVAFAKISLPTPTPTKAPPLRGNSIDDQGGNIVKVEIVGESKCPDTTKFLFNHLLPVFKKYSSRLSISYHPYGPFKYTTCFNNGKDIL
ncbi:hypothetical protein OESDEN_18242 [Oesophagostomum dentatum]|uniref:Uncharacterized protein n=1 Tax=Oesophagostomum dentatum TaxID=61180 RepID=A0A0B1SDV4_OESDE|nr:hypothetical protein OESDEN_18242 [Oesophagostomum dentatum]